MITPCAALQPWIRFCTLFAARCDAKIETTIHRDHDSWAGVLLRARPNTRNDQPAMDGSPERGQRRLVILIAATALCYLIGYPLALVGHSPVGWIFVTLGGPLLIALGVVVIRRVHHGSEAARRADDVPEDS